MTKKICDITEVASYLQVSVSEIRKLVRERKIPHFRVGNRLKFDLINVNNWIEKLEQEQAQNSLFY